MTRHIQEKEIQSDKEGCTCSKCRLDALEIAVKDFKDAVSSIRGISGRIEEIERKLDVYKTRIERLLEGLQEDWK